MNKEKKKFKVGDPVIIKAHSAYIMSDKYYGVVGRKGNIIKISGDDHYLDIKDFKFAFFFSLELELDLLRKLKMLDNER